MAEALLCETHDCRKDFTTHFVKLLVNRGHLQIITFCFYLSFTHHSNLFRIGFVKTTDLEMKHIKKEQLVEINL